MTDFGEFYEQQKQAAERLRAEKAKQAQADHDAKVEARKAELGQIYRVALPVFESAKQQLEAHNMIVKWSDNASTHDLREHPMIQLTVKQPQNGLGTGYLSVSGRLVVLTYKKFADRSGGTSVGNAQLELFDAADVERLVKHCISEYFPKP